MIIEGLPRAEEVNHDVCVVGAGPVGLTLALELSRRGRKVLVLESGGLKRDPVTQMLSQGHVVDPRVHDEVEITVARQLGGTSNLWGARCPPFDPIDFIPRAVTGNVGWPIGFDDLRPYYPAACDYARCGAPDFTLADPENPSAEIDTSRIERFSREPAFQKAHWEELRDSPYARICLNSRVAGIDLSPQGVVHSLLLAGNNGLTRSMAVSRVVLAMGGLETARLLLNLQADHENLFGGTAGALGRYYMAHVVGEVADISWASAVTDASYDFKRDDQGGYYRRRMIPSDQEILDHDLPNVSFWPVVPGVADARHGDALLSLAFLALAFRPFGNLLVAEAIRKYHAPPGIPIAPHIRNLLGGLPGAMWQGTGFLYRRIWQRPKIPGFFIRNPSRRYGLSYHAEHLPSRDSHVRLSQDVDATGLRRLTVDLRFDEADAVALLKAHERLGLWLTENRLGQLNYRQEQGETVRAILDVAAHGTHQIGLARMGSDRQSAVVNSDLRTFDLPNLYLAGTSVFPTSGQANPTLTAMALAVRLAQHLASD